MLHNRPHNDQADCFFDPTKIALSADKMHAISDRGNRKGTPEPKRAFLLDGVDDQLEEIAASVGTLYVSGVLMDGMLDTDIAIAYVVDRYVISKSTGEKVFNIKIWVANTATDEQKLSYTYAPTYAWLRGDDADGATAQNCLENAKHFTIVGAVLATFHYAGQDVPFSWHNQYGYNTSGALRIPHDANNPAKDILGNNLLNRGKIKQIVPINNVPVGYFDGTAYLAFTSLTGITIVSYLGTATLTIVGDTITATAGTCDYLELSNGSIYRFGQIVGALVLDEVNNLDATWTSYTNPTQWTRANGIVCNALVDGFNINKLIEESDFSVGTDGWSILNSVAIGNIDLITDEVTVTKSDVLKLYPSSAVLTSHRLSKILFVIGNNYDISFDYYVPSTNTNVTGFTLYEITPGFKLIQNFHNVNGSPSAWTNTGILNITAEGTELALYQTAGTTYNFVGVGAGTDDLLYIKNIKIVDKSLIPRKSGTSKDIDGDELTYRGAEVEKYIPEELGLQLDFTAYNAMKNGLPSDYTHGDTLTVDMISDRFEAGEEKKLMIGEGVFASKKANRYTRSTNTYYSNTFESLAVNETFSIILAATTPQTYIMDWGDGVEEAIQLTTTPTTFNYIYANIGEHVFTLFGDLLAITNYTVNSERLRYNLSALTDFGANLTDLAVIQGLLNGAFPSIAHLTGLVNLDAWSNSFTKLPDPAGLLKLEWYKLYSNNLDSSPIPSFQNLPALVNLDFNSSTDVNDCTGTMDVRGCPSIATLTATNNEISAVQNLSDNVALTYFRIIKRTGAAGAMSYTASTLALTITFFRLNRLNQTDVDQVLEDINTNLASRPITGSVELIDGDAPSAAGLVNKANIIAHGWTVTTL